MINQKLALALMVVFSITVHQQLAATCNDDLSGKDEGVGSAAEVDASTESFGSATNVALTLFPNRSQLQTFSRLKPLNNADTKAFKAAEAEFERLLREASQDVTIVPYTHLPMVLTTHENSPIRHQFHLKWAALQGQVVVGRVGRYSNRTLENKELLVDETQDYFSGRVQKVNAKVSAIENGGRVTLALDTIEGPREIELVYNWDSTLHNHSRLYLVRPYQTDEEIVRSAMESARLEELAMSALGGKDSQEDYDVAFAAIETALSVPPSYAASAVIKILLGRRVQNGESYKAFGIARGRYKEAQIKDLVSPLYVFMETIGVLGPNEANVDDKGDDENENRIPDWFEIRRKTALAKPFLEIWRELKNKKGGATLDVQPRKARDPKSTKVTRDVAVPGARVVVQPEIRLMAGSDLVPFLTVQLDPGAIKVKPGQELRIVKAPRRQGAHGTRIRVFDPETGQQGEVYWTELMQSTKLIVD